MPGTDVSSSVETDKENDSSMVSDGEQNTTDQLLDSTYNKPASVMYGKSPMGKTTSFLMNKEIEEYHGQILRLTF